MPKRYLHGLMTWKVMQRNVWKDIANLRIKTTGQLYKVATPCMAINSKKKNMDQLQNYQLSAHKFFGHVYIWHVFGT